MVLTTPYTIKHGTIIAVVLGKPGCKNPKEVLRISAKKKPSEILSAKAKDEDMGN